MSPLKKSGEGFFEILQRQRECLDGLDALHQPVTVKRYQNGVEKIEDSCKTCECPRFDLPAWPCETRKLLDRLGVGK